MEPSHFYPDFGRGYDVVLMEVLESDFLRIAVPQMFPINLKSARKFSLLDRFEFEGSLIRMLLEGTCNETVVASETEAREIAAALLAETVLRLSGYLIAFRMDDSNWSNLTRKATKSSTYFVFIPTDNTWWFLGFDDDY